MIFRRHVEQSRAQRPLRESDLEEYVEVQRYKELQQQKVGRYVGRIFDHLLDRATSYGGLTRIDGTMDEFDFNRLRYPRRHQPGYMREVRFEDGVMLQTTTANALSDAVHNLFIYKGRRPNEYWQRPVNVDSQAYAGNKFATGDDKIAAIPGIMYDLGKIETTFDIERENRWPHAMTVADLEKLRKASPEA